MLFNVDVEETTRIDGIDIEFKIFKNTDVLFNMYEHRCGHFFCSNFEYINKISLNPKYEVLYRDENGIDVYIYDRGKLVAFDVIAYLHLKELGVVCDGIKFVSRLEKRVNVRKYGVEYVDAIYVPEGLALMQGARYSRIRGNRNNFLNHVDIDKLSFVEYNISHKSEVLRLYDGWKQMSKENGNTFIVDARVFKSGLDNDYIHKFLLIYNKKIIGFISYLIKGKWVFIYSMKSTRDIPNSNTYMVNQMWKYIMENHSEVEFVNLGGIDNVGAKGTDYKMLLKPDHLLYYYSNVEVE